MRGLRDVEMEREHLTWAGSVVGSAVLWFLEHARRRRAASRGVSPNPAPRRLKPLSAGEPQLPNTPTPRAILVDLEHPGSRSFIISWCRVCRDGGRDASRSWGRRSLGCRVLWRVAGEMHIVRTVSYWPFRPRADGRGSWGSQVPADPCPRELRQRP